MLDRIIVPKLGSKKVAAVALRDIEAFHIGLKDRPYLANRVLALLSKMFSLAVQWQWRADHPVKGIRRFDEEKRDRWLSEEELRRLCRVLDEHPNQRSSNAVRLQLLTGARLGEVLTAERADFDLERGVWTKPSHHTKQKRREHIPLSTETRALVSTILSEALPRSSYLFPGDAPGKPLQDVKKFWASALRKAGIQGIACMTTATPTRRIWYQAA